jgi:hypothetical protein
MAARKGLEDDIPREAYEATLLQMLLQQHRSLVIDRLVLGLFGRAALLGLTLYAGVPSETSVTQLAAVSVLTLLVAGTWFTRDRRWGAELAGVEKALAARTGGAVEELYIESRYFISRVARISGAWILTRYEPLLWGYAVLGILAVRVLLEGIAI